MKKRFLSMLVLLVAVVSGAWAQWTGGTYTATANENPNAINVSDDATLTINQGVTVTVSGGITVASGKKLTITGGGTLVANGANGQTGNAGGTAIAGNVIINGVGLTVTATGGQGGQGAQGDQGDQGADGSNGYDGGQGGKGAQGANGGSAFSGAVTIYAGSVTANGGKGGQGGKGGNGGDGGAGDEGGQGGRGGKGGDGGNGGNGGYAFAGTLTVYGGNVSAYGGQKGPYGNVGDGGDGGDGGIGGNHGDPGDPGEWPGDDGKDGVAYANNVTFEAATYTVKDNSGDPINLNNITSELKVIIQSADVVPVVTYSVALAEGTEDAANWTISPASAAEGETVTITYTGTKRVKSVKAVKKAAAGTDLSMVDNAGAARTSMWTANCYMVHTAGNYKLPLVYGNAIKNGAANSAAYTGIENENTTLTFPNHAGTAIDAPWITKATTGEGVNKGMGITVDKAELLWQDAQGLVTAVGISDDGDYLTLTVGKDATEQQGNALVAAKDASDNIVWSWHIWVTKETFAADDLTTVTTGTGELGTDYQIYKVTPVNLGWVPTGGDGKQGYNTFYQWGRKDPFKGTGAPNDLTVYGIDGTAIAGMEYTSSTATIANNIKNPTTHYYNTSTYGPCTTTYYNMWDAQQTDIDNITTATVKTVYDPCPAGFCVPTGNLYFFMGNGSTRSMTTWDNTNKGATWNTSITGTALFFPASGYRGSSSGSLSSNGNGYCWSASPESDSYGHNLRINSSNWSWNRRNLAYGHPVRAVAEE